MHGAVEAAIHIEIAGERGDVVLRRVIHLDTEFIGRAKVEVRG
jgi:hypothetical protein